jgi:hypothetical protein
MISRQLTIRTTGSRVLLNAITGLTRRYAINLWLLLKSGRCISSTSSMRP